MATLGSEAKKVRRMGERRIARLNKVIAAAAQEDSNIPERVANWAKQTKKEIQSAMQGTRMYAKDGHRYKSKTQRYIQQQIERLNNAISRVVPKYEPPTETLASVTMQINLASSKQTEESSVYTQQQVHVFYRVTEDIWRKKGIKHKDRNKAILNYFNDIREQHELSPLSLHEIMELITNANKDVIDMGDIDTSIPLTEEQQELYEKAMSSDDSDNDKTSPTMAAVLYAIRPLIDDLLRRPSALTEVDEEK